MAKSYEQLQRQIANLQAEAEKLRRKEIAEVVARIREAIRHYGITAADLGLAEGATRRRGKAKAQAAAGPRAGAARKGASKAKSAVILYRDAQGNGWVGRGKRPQWLRDALIAGHELEEFRVKNG